MSELPFRVAFRAEGNFWNAYLASPGTMEGAKHIGSILLAAVSDNPERKQAFMDLMQDFVGDIISEVVGAKPEWSEPRDAPPNERAGSA